MAGLWSFAAPHAMLIASLPGAHARTGCASHAAQEHMSSHLLPAFVCVAPFFKVKFKGFRLTWGFTPCPYFGAMDELAEIGVFLFHVLFILKFKGFRLCKFPILCRVRPSACSKRTFSCYFWRSCGGRYPIAGAAKPVSSARDVASQSVRGHILAHFLPAEPAFYP